MRSGPLAFSLITYFFDIQGEQEGRKRAERVSTKVEYSKAFRRRKEERSRMLRERKRSG
jgi:hypothetical protein